MSGDGARPVAPALPASSILLIRDGAGGLEVLMIERAKTMRFAPGALVFPGGKVDQTDFDRWRWRRFLKHDRRQFRDEAFRMAAIRELYEETHILLSDFDGKVDIPKRMDFEKLLKVFSPRLNLSVMEPFAHWVTPETMPRRFDTYFFLAADDGHLEDFDGEEAVSARWLNPRKVLSDWESDKVPLMFPTRLNLMKLARSSTVEAALQATRQQPVVKVLPKIRVKDHGVDLTIRKEAGYDVTRATEKELSVESAKR